MEEMGQNGALCRRSGRAQGQADVWEDCRGGHTMPAPTPAP